jgi:hypothetical protein
MKNIIITRAGLKSIIIIILFLFTGISTFSQTEKPIVIGQQPVYKVARAREPITVDGKMDEASWKNAEVQSFDYFFRRDKAPEKQKSKFRMLWDDKTIYLYYEFEDTSLTARETNFDGRPYMDDCAEFFVVPIPDSAYMHFGFEVNVTKAAYDYIVLWRFYNNRTYFITSYNPEYEVGATYDGTLNDDTDKDNGWTMEFAIPIDAFREFASAGRVRAGTRWAFQAVRQDRNFVNDRFRSTSLLFPVFDVRQDVHPPAHFGIMEFTDN